MSIYSNQAIAKPEASNDVLPEGWKIKDIDTTLTPSTVGYSPNRNNTFIIRGSGTGVNGASDSHAYLYRGASGNLTFTARLMDATWQWKTGYNNVGILFRESLNPNSKIVFLSLGEIGARLTRFGNRSKTGVSITWQTGNKFTWLPVWFRIQRMDSTFSAYQSSDGETWFFIGSSTIYMSNNYYIGFSVSTGSTTGGQNTAIFENLAIIGGDDKPYSK